MTGYFFGSFDPPHIGHVNVVTAALNSDVVDKVIVIPAFKSVWKNTETSYHYRLVMCHAAFGKIPNVEVSSMEEKLSNGQPLPTYKVLEHIIKGNDNFVIITTTETYREIPEWQNGNWIMENCNFLVVHSRQFEPVDLRGCDVSIYPPSIQICSTNLRNKIKNRKLIQPFIQDNVLQIIESLGLYE